MMCLLYNVINVRYKKNTKCNSYSNVTKINMYRPVIYLQGASVVLSQITVLYMLEKKGAS